jgi:hypothetical protein
MWLIKRNIKMKKITFLILVGTLLTIPLSFAAAPEQKLVAMEYQKKVTKKQKKVTTTSRKKSTAAQSAVAPVVYDCRVQVAAVNDNRNNKVTLGANWVGPLLPAGVDTWLEAVRTQELVNKTSSWSGSRQLEIKPTLTRLYSYAESMNIHGVISLNVEYWLDNKLVDTKFYRGVGSKANMMNALGEYATALNYAVHEMAPQVIEDAKQLCKK